MMPRALVLMVCCSLPPACLPREGYMASGHRCSLTYNPIGPMPGPLKRVCLAKQTRQPPWTAAVQPPQFVAP